MVFWKHHNNPASHQLHHFQQRHHPPRLDSNSNRTIKPKKRWKSRSQSTFTVPIPSTLLSKLTDATSKSSTSMLLRETLRSSQVTGLRRYRRLLRKRVCRLSSCIGRNCPSFVAAGNTRMWSLRAENWATQTLEVWRTLSLQQVQKSKTEEEKMEFLN